jgi:hypothetical protein
VLRRARGGAFLNPSGAKPMKSKILKLATLIELHACTSQTDLFKERFGESVEITETLCEGVATLFDFDWAARNLLTAPAWAEYQRVRALAFAKLYIGD